MNKNYETSVSDICIELATSISCEKKSKIRNIIQKDMEAKKNCGYKKIYITHQNLINLNSLIDSVTNLDTGSRISIAGYKDKVSKDLQNLNEEYQAIQEEIRKIIEIQRDILNLECMFTYKEDMTILCKEKLISNVLAAMINEYSEILTLDKSSLKKNSRVSISDVLGSVVIANVSLKDTADELSKKLKEDELLKDTIRKYLSKVGDCSIAYVAEADSELEIKKVESIYKCSIRVQEQTWDLESKEISELLCFIKENKYKTVDNKTTLTDHIFILAEEILKTLEMYF